MKAKLLDWKPAVLENKTRHQATKAREVTAYKEIFGIDLPGAKKSKGGKGSKKAKSVTEKPSEDQPTNDEAKSTPKKAPKKGRKPKQDEVAEKKEPDQAAPEPEKPTEPEEEVVTEEAEKLQNELQGYALDLLDSNSSWERRTVIQNLVIWEPVTDPAVLALPPSVAVPGTVAGTAVPINIQPVAFGRKRGKKIRKRQSGLDFSRKKSNSGKCSRDISRAHSPVNAGEAGDKDVIHSLDNILNDSKHMVMDKSAGETILHRAAKMGYPDVAAYALDMAKMSATVKDNAGFPPIHKAALKGHAEIIDYLIR